MCRVRIVRERRDYYIWQVVYIGLPAVFRIKLFVNFIVVIFTKEWE